MNSYLTPFSGYKSKTGSVQRRPENIYLTMHGEKPSTVSIINLRLKFSLSVTLHHVSRTYRCRSPICPSTFISTTVQLSLTKQWQSSISESPQGKYTVKSKQWNTFTHMSIFHTFIYCFPHRGPFKRGSNRVKMKDCMKPCPRCRQLLYVLHGTTEPGHFLFSWFLWLPSSTEWRSLVIQ